MHIENELKLDFKDVLIRPKRSTLTSRNQVDITREIKFRHSPEVFNAVPIIAANMDTTGTFAMARALGHHNMMTALCKHYSVEEYVEFFNKLEVKSQAFYSLGIGDADYEKFKAVMAKAPGAIRYVCIDVANGYTEAFVSFVKKMRDTYPDLVIMAGNVVTGDMTEELVLAGADIVKVGNTSLTVKVDVYAEHITRGRNLVDLVTEAELVYVCLGPDDKPLPVKESRRRYFAAHPEDSAD